MKLPRGTVHQTKMMKNLMAPLTKYDQILLRCLSRPHLNKIIDTSLHLQTTPLPEVLKSLFLLHHNQDYKRHRQAQHPRLSRCRMRRQKGPKKFIGPTLKIIAFSKRMTTRLTRNRLILSHIYNLVHVLTTEHQFLTGPDQLHLFRLLLSLAFTTIPDPELTAQHGIRTLLSEPPPPEQVFQLHLLSVRLTQGLFAHLRLHPLLNLLLLSARRLALRANRFFRSLTIPINTQN